jgi:AraC family transcriptional regulator of adaptative response / DNA-3-methyladenine glycosylase II
VEQVIGDAYLRTVDVDGQPGVIECRADGDSLALSLHGIGTPVVFGVVQRVRELFDVDAPLDEIVAALGADATLTPLLARHPGIRVPGAWDGFELTVRAVLGQQVSVKAATTLAGRVAQRYGHRADVPASLAHYGDRLALDRVFPAPQNLVRARFNDIGLTTSRAATLRGLASAVVRGDVAFEPGQDPDAFCGALVELHGIGDWTAEYVAMRALKNPDAFPASDLGLMKALGINNAKKLAARADAWRPWRAYAALLLWGSLAGSGG